MEDNTPATYSALDAAIIRRIADGAIGLHTIDAGDVRKITKRLAEATGREPYRVLDGRLQALRKQGLIKHVQMTQSDFGGWRLAEGVGHV